MTAKLFMKLLLISLLLSTLISEVPSKDYKDWITIQDKEIWIGYTNTNFPWCKVKRFFNNTIDEILPIIEDVNNYYKIFDSLVYSKKDSNDIVHIKVDYPRPFSDRDYIVKFQTILDEKDIVYKFESVKNSNKLIEQNYIRLINAAGEWRLSKIEENLTEVSYVWNGELRGKMPNWTLSRAWIKQGNEIMENLKTHLDKGDN